MLTTKDILIIKALVEEEMIKSEEITDVNTLSVVNLYKNSLFGIKKELNFLEKTIETECICN